jgi:hypothetical protein
MSAFGDLRAALAAELTPPMGVDVHPAWPDVLQPPCAFLAPPLADDYAKRGPNFGEHTIALDLVILVDHGEAAAALTALEELIEAALVNTADWALTGVESPAPTTVTESGAEYLACVIHLSRAVQL